MVGAIVGALFLGPLPELVEEFSDKINFTVPLVDQPLLKDSATSEGIMSNAVFSEILFSVLLVVFLMFQPRGLVGLWHRMVASLKRRGTPTDDAGPDIEPVATPH